MKKTLLSGITFFAITFASAQITLENTFPNNEEVASYSKGSDTYYFSTTSDNKIKIYKADYSLFKTINTNLPNGYLISVFYNNTIDPYMISKHLFNSDDKLEIIVKAQLADNTTVHRKLLVINEDGELIKDFNPDFNKSWGKLVDIFHDNISNQNKMIVEQITNNTSFYEVYLLPSSILNIKELKEKEKLTAFPIPTNSNLNIINPKNGSNKIEIFDMVGKILLSKSILNSEDKISINVENLPKGIYVYKVGELSSKFIKN